VALGLPCTHTDHFSFRYKLVRNLYQSLWPPQLQGQRGH